MVLVIIHSFSFCLLTLLLFLLITRRQRHHFHGWDLKEIYQWRRTLLSMVIIMVIIIYGHFSFLSNQFSECSLMRTDIEACWWSCCVHTLRSFNSWVVSKKWPVLFIIDYWQQFNTSQSWWMSGLQLFQQLNVWFALHLSSQELQKISAHRINQTLDWWVGCYGDWYCHHFNDLIKFEYSVIMQHCYII